MKERVRMQLVLDPELKKRIEREAKKRDISNSALVRMAIYQYTRVKK